MIEIKMGDRVNGYYSQSNQPNWDRTGREPSANDDVQYITGKVIDIKGEGLLIETDDYNYKNFHHKQCRKLVTMRKCDGCGGKGFNYRGATYSAVTCSDCEICNGKGKVLA